MLRCDKRHLYVFYFLLTLAAVDYELKTIPTTHNEIASSYLLSMTLAKEMGTTQQKQSTNNVTARTTIGGRGSLKQSNHNTHYEIASSQSQTINS